MDDQTIGAQAPGVDAAVYLELAPLPRHRAFVDHLFILRDDGMLTAAKRGLFASPFREINFTFAHNQAVDGWKLMDLPPRFGSARRRRPFHGWILGIRCLPFDPLEPVWPGRVLPAALLRPFDGGITLERAAGLLDICVDQLLGEMMAPAAGAMAWPPTASSRGLADVRAAACALRVSPRTLQRRVRTATGLAPKRWLALLRFAKAARNVALAPVNLADIAVAAGYADQAHMSAEFARHAAISPGRLRAQARRQRCGDAVRFLQDPALRGRLRLLIAEP